MDDLISKRELDSKGLCQQSQNPRIWDSFFAEDALTRRTARNLCLSGDNGKPCPVKEQCLRWALEKKEIWGVWGGCDESELRRALWVDSNGVPTSRNRFPQCPNCKARPNRLHVVSLCMLSTGKRQESVECSCCKFAWRAPSSVAAVKAYNRDRAKKSLSQALKIIAIRQ